MSREVQPNLFFASSTTNPRVSGKKTSQSRANSPGRSNSQARRRPTSKNRLQDLLFPSKSPKKQQVAQKKKRTSPSGLNPIVANSPQESSPKKLRQISGKSRQSSAQKQHKSLNLFPLPLAIATRVIVLTVGMSTILGSAISIANSFNTAPPPKAEITPTNVTTEDKKELESLFSVVSLGKEIPALKSKLLALTAQYSQLEAGIFLVDLDNKNHVSVQGSTVFSAASTIKVPVLVAFFQDVDAGKIRLDEQLSVTKEVIGDGSGYFQYEGIGTKLSALRVATEMIRVSDNTATNMLIQRLGGIEAVNQRFAEMGLTSTIIRNPLPDLTGTNTTTAEDLGNLLIRIDRGELISLRSRDRFLEIMRKTKTNTLLPQGLEEEAEIAHKTGDILTILGDVGIIDMPNGKRYVASVLVKRPDNDPQAKALIQKISQTTYQHFKFDRSQPFIE